MLPDGRNRRPGRIVASVAVVVVMTGMTMVMIPAAASPSLGNCLTQNKVIRLSGSHTEQVKYSSPGPRTTFDARGGTFTSSPADTLYPIDIAKYSAPADLCFVGGTVIGQQSRDLTWDEVKDDYSGSGLRIGGNRPYVVDGLRVDNVADGIRPRGTEDLYPKDGDGFTIRNTYLTYIRDDCVENDDIAGGVIFDSLFDGCYTGISERPSSGNEQENHPAPPGETLVLNHVLLRLQALPGVRKSHDPSVLGHGQLFKWSDVANTPVVRNSIFLVDTVPSTDSYFPFPPGTTTSNVTIVWGADEPFEWDVPPGTSVTTDRSVWTDARQEWLDRHGCTSFTSCTRLTTPDPLTTTGSLLPSAEVVVEDDPNDTPGRLDVDRLVLTRREDQTSHIRFRMFGRWGKRLLHKPGPNRIEVLFDTAPGGGAEYRSLIYEKRGKLMSRFSGQGSVLLGPVRRPNRRTAILLVPNGAAMTPHGVGVIVRARFYRPGGACAPACVDRAPDAGFLRGALASGT